MATLTINKKRYGSISIDSDFSFTDKLKVIDRIAWIGYWQDSPNSAVNYYFTVRWSYCDRWVYTKSWSLSQQEYKTLLAWLVYNREIKQSLSSHGDFKNSLEYKSNFGFSPMPIHAQIEFYL